MEKRIIVEYLIYLLLNYVQDTRNYLIMTRQLQRIEQLDLTNSLSCMENWRPSFQSEHLLRLVGLDNTSIDSIVHENRGLRRRLGLES